MLKDRLEQLIKTLDLKKGDFADKINFSQAYISMILSGTKQNPSDRFFDSIKREFNVNIDWLKYGQGEMFSLNEENLSPLEKDLLTKYNLLPLSERKIIDLMVDTMLSKHNDEQNN